MVRVTSTLIVCLMSCAALGGFPGVTEAQDPGTTNVSGNTDVYSSATGSQAHSPAYIDASAFYYYDISQNLPGVDICTIINQILKGTALKGVSYPTAGAVIEAHLS
jgi:hypothetical protein